jgi:mRNA-degrading endonuclease RelE of RelBE toxin-antitoxin system
MNMQKSTVFLASIRRKKYHLPGKITKFVQLFLKIAQTNTKLNPCEHRGTIVARAYLKSFKKGKQWDRRIFFFEHIKNFDLVPKK